MRATNLTLLTDLYELTMMQGYFKNPQTRLSSSICFTAPTPAAAVSPLPPGWSR